MREKLRHTHFWKSVQSATFYTIATVTFFLSFAQLMPKINTDWLDAEKLIVEHVQFSDLFFRFHAKDSCPSYNGRQVFIVDISGYQEREQIAELFDSLYAAEPYMVALDIIFGDYAIQDTATNRRLTESVKRLPNLVLAQEIRAVDTDRQTSLRSFFADEVQAEEALVNLPTAIVRKWHPAKRIGNDTLPMFAAAIARKMGVKVPMTEEEWLIDYSIRDTIVLRPKMQSFDFRFLRNQVVIVGDVQDLRDTHVVPFAFRTTMRMSGVLVHKQIVQTLMAHHWLREASKAWEWFFLSIVIWLFIFLDERLSYITKKDKQEQYRVLVSFAKFLTLSTAILITYLLFYRAHVYCNAWSVILAPAMFVVFKGIAMFIAGCIQFVIMSCRYVAKAICATRNSKKR